MKIHIDSHSFKYCHIIKENGVAVKSFLKKDWQANEALAEYKNTTWHLIKFD